MNCSESNFIQIRERSCFELDNGKFVIKIGLINNLNCLLDFLKQQEEKKIVESSYVDANPGLSFDFINKHQLLQKLIIWYQQIGNEDINDDNKHGFCTTFY
jgi:hypothetical protein